MSVSGKGVYQVNSDWSSGNLIFFEKAVGRTATGDVLTIGTTAVTVGGTAQAVDFAWYAAGSLSFILSASDSSMTLVGCNVAIDGDIVIGTDDLAVEQGYYLYLDGLSGGEYVRSASANYIIVNGTTGIDLGIGGTAEVSLIANSFEPATSDGCALGTGTDMWSDLFLASAGAINFNAGNVTITHAAGALACTGALTLSIATASTSTTTGGLIVTGGVGVGGAAYIGTILGMNSAASDIIVIANTAAALEVYDSTTKLLAIDSRNTVAAVSQFTFTSAAARTLPNAAAASFSLVSLASLTETLAGVTGVTTPMDGILLSIGTPTINQSGGAVVVDEASTVHIAAAPVAGASVTLTAPYALYVDSGDVRFDGTTASNYLLWDDSADDLLLVGTATQFAVAGTEESVSTTTGSLRTAGGLACVGDFYAGDDIFLTSGAILNWGAGDAAITHSTGVLAITPKLTVTGTGDYTSPAFSVTRTFVTSDFDQTYHAAARVNLDLTNDVPDTKYASAFNIRVIGAGDVASGGQLYGLWVDSAGTGAAIGGTYYMAKFSVQSGAARPTAYMHFESADPGVTYAFVFATNNAPYYNQGGTYSTADGYLLVSTFNGDRRIPLFADVDG